MMKDVLPLVAEFDLSHNFLRDVLILNGLRWNYDISHNNISLLSLQYSQQPTGLSAASRRGKLHTLDMRHQASGMFLSWSNAAEFSSIDEVLESTSNGMSFNIRSLDFVPQHDSFEQVELPPGSGRFPFSCPTW